MKKNEGLVGVVLFIAVTLIAVFFTGCDDSEIAWTKVLTERRESGFVQCAKFCGARPGKTAFDEHGKLLTCQCAADITDSVEVE